MFVESKTKNSDHIVYRNWTVVQKNGAQITNYPRGGSLILVKASLYPFSIIIGDFNINPQKSRQVQNFLQQSKFLKYKTEPTFLMAHNPDSTPDLIFYSNSLKEPSYVAE